MPLEPHLRNIYTKVGEISSTWNQIENFWYLIFTGLFPGADRLAIDAVYNQFQTFNNQRKLIVAVADATLTCDTAKLKARDPSEHLKRRIRKVSCRLEYPS